MAFKNAKVLVIGAGGLARLPQYLAAAGVGTIVIDADVVENANLQRQIIHADQSIGLPKVFSHKLQCLHKILILKSNRTIGVWKRTSLMIFLLNTISFWRAAII